MSMGLPTAGKIIVQDGRVKVAFNGEAWSVADEGNPDFTADKHHAAFLVERLNHITPRCLGNHITAEQAAARALEILGSKTAEIVEVGMPRWETPLPDGAVD